MGKVMKEESISKSHEAKRKEAQYRTELVSDAVKYWKSPSVSTSKMIKGGRTDLNLIAEVAADVVGAVPELSRIPVFQEITDSRGVDKLFNLDVTQFSLSDHFKVGQRVCVVLGSSSFMFVPATVVAVCTHHITVEYTFKIEGSGKCTHWRESFTKFDCIHGLVLCDNRGARRCVA